MWRGLYGALIVDGPEEPELGMEAVLILSDLALAGAELQAIDPADFVGAFFGHQGQEVQVNGRSLPSIRVRAGAPLRLRFINAAVARYFRLAVAEHQLARVAGDSGFLERPEQHQSMLVVPGERSEAVLVPQGPVGSVHLLEALPYDRFSCGGPACEQSTPLLRIEVVEDGGTAPDLPDQLATIAPIDVSRAVEHTIAMTQDTRANGDGVFGLNHQVYSEDPFMLMAQVGETHVWVLDNQTDYDHPFHLHGFRFQVLERAGEVPAVGEWKDTLNLPRRTTSRIAVTFDDRPGMWMLHCHILDHADFGMMGMLHVAQPNATGHVH
ncbi:MAG: multicopper oxidase family protein [Myxococcales bacterium]